MNLETNITQKGDRVYTYVQNEFLCSIWGMEKINFAIVENDPLALDWLRRAIQGQEAWQVQWCAENLAEAFDALNKLPTPKVVLIDLGLPDGSGLQLIRHLAKCDPDCITVVVTVFGEELRILSSIRAGAKGYLQKGALQTTFVRQVFELLDGVATMSPNIARLVLNDAQNHRYIRVSEILCPTSLSPRQIEIIELVSKGFNYSEISKLLNISVNTVKTHVKNIYDFLNASNQTEAVYEAQQYGII